MAEVEPVLQSSSQLGVTDTKPPTTLLIASTVTPNFHLAKVLEATLDGKSILANYKEQNSLTTFNRNKLCSIIAEHWVDTKAQVVSDDYKHAANEIIKLFPTEDKVFNNLNVF